jgi:CRP-like cAMP-binding protein
MGHFSNMMVIMFDNIVSVLASLGERKRHFKKGAHLFHQGDPVRLVFVVIEGSVELTRYQQGGNSLILQRAGSGTFLAEASVYSEVYHCDAIVAETCTTLEMNRTAFMELLASQPEIHEVWAAHLARQVQSARYRSEILARKNVSERLDGWLAWKDGKLPARGRWRSVAEEISVSPEALYRELSKRRKRQAGG